MNTDNQDDTLRRKRKKPGPRPKPIQDLRNQRLVVSLTTREKAQILLESKKRGMTVSALAREAIFKHTAKE